MANEQTQPASPAASPLPIEVRAAISPQPFDADIPVALQESVRRHQENLRLLIHSCRQAGVGESQIETAINVLIDSYKAELIAAIKALSSPEQDSAE